MSKNRVRFYVSLAILFALFAAVAFAVPFVHGGAFWLSVVFAAIAFGVQLLIYPRAFDFEGNEARSKFYGFPLARLATVYLAVQLGLSLLFMVLGTFTPMPGWVPAVAGVLVLAAALLGLNTVGAIRDEVERQDVQLKANVGLMRNLQSKAAYIASQCDDSETKKALNKLSESFRFSDPVSADTLADIETSLSALTDELQNAVLEKDFAAAGTLCSKVEAALAERNRLCRLNK